MKRQFHRPRRMPRSLASHMLRAGALGLVLAAPAAARAEPAEAIFSSADGQEIGSAQLTDTPNGLLIELDLSGLPAESWVGFHIHENGACDAQDGFKSAGGHYAGAAGAHGFLVEEGPHAGDMPNQYVSAEGILKSQVFNAQVTMQDVSGRAFIIHGGSDDYESQPSGDAGPRIACAMID